MTMRKEISVCVPAVHTLRVEKYGRGDMWRGRGEVCFFNTIMYEGGQKKKRADIALIGFLNSNLWTFEPCPGQGRHSRVGVQRLNLEAAWQVPCAKQKKICHPPPPPLQSNPETTKGPQVAYSSQETWHSGSLEDWSDIWERLLLSGGQTHARGIKRSSKHTVKHLSRDADGGLYRVFGAGPPTYKAPRLLVSRCEEGRYSIGLWKKDFAPWICRGFSWSSGWALALENGQEAENIREWAELESGSCLALGSVGRGGTESLVGIRVE